MSDKIPFDFDEYIRQSEPDKQKKGYIWQTAIGLQDVDGLKPSEYLIETAKKNIDGDITLEEANDLIHSYYESKTARLDIEDRTEEADKVSARIAQILSEDAFVFSPNQLIAIHRSYLMTFINLPVSFAITIFPNVNGFYKANRLYTQVRI